MAHKNKEEKAIYSLYTLNDSTGIRYVGITKQPLKNRLQGHIVFCKQAFKHRNSLHHRHCWIKSLLDKGEQPTINLISEYSTIEEALKAEIQTITLYRKIYKLVNTTNSGDGLRGYKWNNKQKERQSFKVDQYDIEGNFIQTFESYSDAAFIISGKRSNNGKISGCTKGKYGRKTFCNYVWRKHGDPFDKYPVVSNLTRTPEMKKRYSNSKLGDKNPMKNKTGLKNPTSKPVIILNSNDIILTITESVKETIEYTKLSKSTIEKMLKLNKEIAGYKLIYANKDIVQSLQKCKSSTLKTFVGQNYALEVEH